MYGGQKMGTHKRRMPTLRLRLDSCTVYCKFNLLSEALCEFYGVEEVYKIRWEIKGRFPCATTGYSFTGAIGKMLRMIKDVLKDDDTDRCEVFESDDDDFYDLVFRRTGKERYFELRCYLEEGSQDRLVLTFDESQLVYLGIYCQLFEGQLNNFMLPVEHMYDLGVFQGEYIPTQKDEQQQVEKTLDVPFGKFWLTANGEPIDFEIEDHTEERSKSIKEIDPRYTIERAYVLRPKLPLHFDELDLRICTDHRDNVKDKFFHDGMWLLGDHVVAIMETWIYIVTMKLMNCRDIQMSQINLETCFIFK